MDWKRRELKQASIRSLHSHIQHTPTHTSDRERHTAIDSRRTQMRAHCENIVFSPHAFCIWCCVLNYKVIQWRVTKTSIRIYLNKVVLLLSQLYWQEWIHSIDDDGQDQPRKIFVLKLILFPRCSGPSWKLVTDVCPNVNIDIIHWCFTIQWIMI